MKAGAASLLFLVAIPFSCRSGEGGDCEEKRLYSECSGEPCEPPINIFMPIHVDLPFNMDRIFTRDYYYDIRYNLLKILDNCEEACTPATILFNGWFPQMLVNLDDGAFFEDLVERGHQLGTHIHSVYYDEEEGEWKDLKEDLKRYARSGKYDSEMARDCWEDAKGYMDSALSLLPFPYPNYTVTAVPFIPSDEWIFMESMGFTMAPGGRSDLFYRWEGHTIWNPFRPSSSDKIGEVLGEDPSAPFIFIDHYPQIGAISHKDIDVTLPVLKAAFTLLYIEWLYRERSNKEDRVWTFGFVAHPNRDLHLEEIQDFGIWLNQNFAGEKTLRGNTIAVYSKVEEIYERFLDWEARNPDASSFSYILDDEYPYSFPLLAATIGRGGAGLEGTFSREGGARIFHYTLKGEDLYLFVNEGDEGEALLLDASEFLDPPFHVYYMDGHSEEVYGEYIELRDEPLVAGEGLSGLLHQPPLFPDIPGGEER